MDTRWENVWASVTTYIPAWEGEEQPRDDEIHDYLEFLIEVVMDETVFYQRQIVNKRDLKQFDDLFKFVLDKMVDQLDSYME